MILCRALCLFAYTLFTKKFERSSTFFFYSLFTHWSHWVNWTARNHDALLNCEPQLMKVVPPTQNHSRQIKSIIYIPVITTKLINCCKNNNYCLTYFKKQPNRKLLADWESSREQILDRHSSNQILQFPSTDLKKKTGSSNLLFSLQQNWSQRRHLVATTFAVKLTVCHG